MKSSHTRSESWMLFLDPTTADHFQVGFFTQKTKIDIEDLKKVSVEHLLSSILAWMTKRNFSRESLAGIAVVKGPGPFTQLRMGIVIANTLAYACGIPILGLTQEEGNAKNLEEGLWERVTQQSVGQIVEPFYNPLRIGS